MLYQYLLALVFLISLGGTMFPFLAAPPLSVVTSLFFFQNLFLLFPAALGIFFFGREMEEKMGSSWFLALWAVTAVLSRFLQPSSGVFGFDASASVMGLLGALVALDPLAVTFVEVYPLPAFVSAAVLLFLHFMFSQEFNVVALLLGLAFGYLFVAFKPAPAPPQMAPRPYRRY